MGESTLRQMYLQFLGIIESESFDRIPDQKGERKIEQRLAGSRYTFFYYEYYDNLTINLQDGPPKLYDGRYPDLLIMNDGLHDLLYDHANIDKSWNKLADQLIAFKEKFSVPTMWVPSPQMNDGHLTKHRKTAAWFTNATLFKECVLKQKELYQKGTAFDYYYDIFRHVEYDDWNDDGIHNMERARLEAEGLVRTFYHLNKDPSAWEEDQITAGQLMTFIFYSFIGVIVAISQTLKYAFYRKISPRNSAHTSDEIEMSERASLIASEEQTETDNIRLGIESNLAASGGLLV